jgi:hypothetical protein
VAKFSKQTEQQIEEIRLREIAAKLSAAKIRQLSDDDLAALIKNNGLDF